MLDRSKQIVAKIKELAKVPLERALAIAAVDIYQAELEQIERFKAKIQHDITEENPELAAKNARDLAGIDAKIARIKKIKSKVNEELRSLHQRIVPQQAVAELIPERVQATIRPSAGRSNLVGFYSTRGLQINIAGQPVMGGRLPVVYLHPKAALSPDEIVEARNARQQMYRKKIPADFNQLQLYHDQKGRVLAATARSGDLGKFVERNQHLLGWSKVKDMIGQAVLALYDLHARGFVHRDIKPENFLIFLRNHKCHLKLHDHNFGLAVNKNGNPIIDDNTSVIAGTLGYMPPELGVYDRFVDVENKKDHPNKEEIRKQLAQCIKLDYRKHDCFALGKTIGYLLNLTKGSIPEVANAAVKRLIEGLTHKDPAKRKTLAAAMEMSFFGDTQEECDAFFARLRADAKKYTLAIDGHEHESIDEDNPFYFLDCSIKPIYAVGMYGVQIAEQIAECKEQIQKKCIEDNFSDVVSRFEFLTSCKSRLFKATTQVDQQKAQECLGGDAKAALTQLRDDAEREVGAAWLELLKHPESMAVLLKKAVNEAYLDYVRVNQLEDARGKPPVSSWFDCFALHGQQGRMQAGELRRRIEAQVDSLNNGPAALFAIIRDHFENKGGRRWKTSFKTILNNKLLRLSEKSLEQWTQHFAQMPKQIALHRS